MELAAQGRERDTLTIDASHLEAHRAAASLRGKKGVQTVRQISSALIVLKDVYGCIIITVPLAAH